MLTDQNLDTSDIIASIEDQFYQMNVRPYRWHLIEAPADVMIHKTNFKNKKRL